MSSKKTLKNAYACKFLTSTSSDKSPMSMSSTPSSVLYSKQVVSKSGKSSATKSKPKKTPKSKSPNVYSFLKFVQKRMTTKYNKPRIDLRKCYDDPNSDKNSKVYNQFLQVLVKSIPADGILLKQEFMNRAMT